jgi:hypothetical protein
VTTVAEPLYTDADVKLVADTLWRFPSKTTTRAAAVSVLDALTAADWRPHAIASTIEQANQTRANTRAVVAEEIARAIAENPGPDPSPANPAWWAGWAEGRDDAARIAREIGGCRG